VWHSCLYDVQVGGYCASASRMYLYIAYFIQVVSSVYKYTCTCRYRFPLMFHPYVQLRTHLNSCLQAKTWSHWHSAQLLRSCWCDRMPFSRCWFNPKPTQTNVPSRNTVGCGAQLWQLCGRREIPLGVVPSGATTNAGPMQLILRPFDHKILTKHQYNNDKLPNKKRNSENRLGTMLYWFVLR
jgi:hypothetical protein